MTTIYSGTHLNPMLSRAQINQTLASADSDGDGALTDTEFKNFTTADDTTLSDTARAALFEKLDADADGLLTSDEISAGVSDSIAELQETLRGLDSLEASLAALKDLLGGSSMVDFLNGSADVSSVLNFEDVLSTDLSSTLANTARTMNSDTIANLLADDEA